MVIDNDSRSSSPIDPNDKYSVFRSHCRDVEPVLTASSTASTNVPIASSGWTSTSGGTVPQESAGIPALFGDFKRAGESEAWADFQHSGSATKLTSSGPQNSGHAALKPNAFPAPKDGSSFQTTEKPNSTAILPTVGLSLEGGSQSFERKEEDDFGIFAGAVTSSSSGDDTSTETSFSASFAKDGKNAFATANRAGSWAITVTKDSSSSSTIIKTESHFGGFSAGNFSSYSKAGSIEAKHPSTQESSNDDFHDFSSFESSTSSINSLPKVPGWKEDLGNTPAVTLSSDLNSRSSQTVGSSTMNDSWNEFTSFSSGHGSLFINTGAVDSNKQDDQFAQPNLDTSNDIATSYIDINAVVSGDVSKERTDLSKNKIISLQGLNIVDTKPIDSVQPVDSKVSAHVDDEFSEFSFTKHVPDAQVPIFSDDLTANDKVSHGKSDVKNVNSEFADFASFGSAMPKAVEEKHQVIDISDTFGNRDDERSLPSTITLGTSDRKSIEKSDIIPSEPIPKSTAHDDLQAFGTLDSSKEPEVVTKPLFAPSGRVLDVNEQLSSFAATTNAIRKPEMIAKDVSYKITNLSEKKSQDTVYVDPTLDAKDRYKALTGVLEVMFIKIFQFFNAAIFGFYDLRFLSFLMMLHSFFIEFSVFFHPFSLIILSCINLISFTSFIYFLKFSLRHLIFVLFSVLFFV